MALKPRSQNGHASWQAPPDDEDDDLSRAIAASLAENGVRSLSHHTASRCSACIALPQSLQQVLRWQCCPSGATTSSTPAMMEPAAQAQQHKADAPAAEPAPDRAERSPPPAAEAAAAACEDPGPEPDPGPGVQKLLQNDRLTCRSGLALWAMHVGWMRHVATVQCSCRTQAAGL